MAKQPKETPTPADELGPDEDPIPAGTFTVYVLKVDKDTSPGVTYRPGIGYEVKADVRDKLEAAGNLKKD